MSSPRNLASSSVTSLGLIHVKEGLGFDIVDEASAPFAEILDYDLQKVSNGAVEVVLDLGLSSS